MRTEAGTDGCAPRWADLRGGAACRRLPLGLPASRLGEPISVVLICPVCAPSLQQPQDGVAEHSASGWHAVGCQASVPVTQTLWVTRCGLRPLWVLPWSPRWPRFTDEDARGDGALPRSQPGATGGGCRFTSALTTELASFRALRDPRGLACPSPPAPSLPGVLGSRGQLPWPRAGSGGHVLGPGHPPGCPVCPPEAAA